MRVLLDANVLLRILLPSPYPNRPVDRIFEALQAEAFTPLIMDEVIEEVRRRSTTKPNLAARITAERRVLVLTTLREAAIELPRLLPPYPRLCRDAKDDYLLAYAEAGTADLLVTYDEDLLVLDGAFRFPILAPPAFLTVLRERELI